MPGRRSARRGIQRDRGPGVARAAAARPDR